MINSNKTRAEKEAEAEIKALEMALIKKAEKELDKKTTLSA